MRLVPESLEAFVGGVVRHVRPGVASEKVADLLRTNGSVAEAYPVLRQLFARYQIRDFLAPHATEPSEKGASYAHALRSALQAHRSIPVLAQVSFAELTCYMHDVLLRDADQMSMAHSLEVRVPLLDGDVVEYTLGLPDGARRSSSPPKRLLVDAVRDLLPRPVASRPKSGFAMPFDPGIRGPLQGFCAGGIERVAEHESFRADEVHRVWNAFWLASPVPGARGRGSWWRWGTGWTGQG